MITKPLSDTAVTLALSSGLSFTDALKEVRRSQAEAGYLHRCYEAGGEAVRRNARLRPTGPHR